MKQWIERGIIILIAAAVVIYGVKIVLNQKQRKPEKKADVTSAPTDPPLAPTEAFVLDLTVSPTPTEEPGKEPTQGADTQPTNTPTVTPSPTITPTPSPNKVADPDSLSEEEWEAFVDRETEKRFEYVHNGYEKVFTSWDKAATLKKEETLDGKTARQKLLHTEYLCYYNGMVATVHQYTYYAESATSEEPDEILVTYYADATNPDETPVTVWHSYKDENGKMKCDEIFSDGTKLKEFEQEVIARVENNEFYVEMFEENNFTIRFRQQKMNPDMEPVLTLVLNYFDGVYGVTLDNPYRDFNVLLYLVSEEDDNCDTKEKNTSGEEPVLLASFYDRIDY